MMKTIRTFRGRNTTKITNLWKGLKFMYHDHTQFCGKNSEKKKKKERKGHQTKPALQISTLLPRLN